MFEDLCTSSGCKMRICNDRIRLRHARTVKVAFDGKRSNLCYLTCLRHLNISEAVTNWIFFSENTFFPNACATCTLLPSTMRHPVYGYNSVSFSISASKGSQCTAAWSSTLCWTPSYYIRPWQVSSLGWLGTILYDPSNLTAV